MKQELRLIFAAFVAVFTTEGVKAQIPSTYYSAIETDTELYLYNVSSGLFLNQDGDYAQALLSSTPLSFQLAQSGSKYIIKPQGIAGGKIAEDSDMKGDFYMDQKKNWGWVFEETSSGSKLYYFSGDDGSKWVGVGESNRLTGQDMQSADCQWALIKPSDYNSYLIAQNNGNATSLVVSADCSSPLGWSAGSLKTGQKYISGTTSAIQLDASGDVSQTVKDLPAGTYTVQMLIRGDVGNTTDGLTLNSDAKTVVTYIGGNDAKGNVNADGLVFSSNLDTNNDGWVLLEGSTTLATAGDLTITVSLASGGKWAQFTSVKLLKDINTNPTTATYIDMTSANYFLHFGDTKNQVIKAATNTANTPNVVASGTCASLVLSDGAYNFGVGEDFTATELSYDRSFTADQMSTVCLPFALTAEEVTAAGTFYELTSYSNETLHFNEVSTTEANKPYLFKATSTGTPFSSYSSKAIVAGGAGTTDVTTAAMIGTYTEQTLKSGSNTLYGYRASDGTFVQIGSTNGAHINPFRAYIQVPGASSVKAFNIDLGGDATGIHATMNDELTNSESAGAVYNLNGQRVSRPTRGMYILNGKKVVIK